jgi:DNA mismatch endonuclease (patch repair protein)
LRVAIFVDGCFWHGCPVHGSIPRTNRGFWQSKLEKNKQRDRVVVRELKSRGWKPLRVWQHELRRPGPLLRRLERALTVPSRGRSQTRHGRVRTQYLG